MKVVVYEKWTNGNEYQVDIFYSDSVKDLDSAIDLYNERAKTGARSSSLSNMPGLAEEFFCVGDLTYKAVWDGSGRKRWALQ